MIAILVPDEMDRFIPKNPQKATNCLELHLRQA